MLLLLSALIVLPVNAQVMQKRIGGDADMREVTTKASTRQKKTVNAQLPITKQQKKSQQLSTAAANLVYSNLPNTRKQSPLKVNSNITIWGNVIYSEADDAGNKNAAGYYEIAGNGEFTLLGGVKTDDVSAFAANQEVFVKDGVMWAIDGTNFYGLFIWVEAVPWNMDTWTPMEGDKTLGESFYATTSAYSETDGYSYGSFLTYDDDGNSYWTFAKVDYINGTRTDIKVLDASWNATFFDATNQLYAITYTGDLYKVNKETGDMTLVGNTGFVPKYSTGAAFDKKGGKAYWTVSPEDETGFLTEIDITTGQASKVCDFVNKDEVVGLYVPAPKAEDGAPNYVENLTANFEGNALSGKVSFTMPTTTFDGTAATGALTYKVYVDGNAVATGESSYGANVETAITLTASGKYKIEVSATNSVGEGPKAKLNKFIGYDQPKAPTNVKSVYADGKFTITWDAVTACVNGGYIDPSAVTYTVTRMPDNVAVATGLSTTTVTDPVATPDNFTNYYYNVVAKYADLESTAASSNSVGLGSIQPPYLNDFESDDALEGYTLIDGNNDGNVWTIVNGKARMKYNSSLDMDDWMITPAIRLEAGKVYRISFDANAQSDSFPEAIEAFLGSAPEVSSMVTCLVSKTDVYKDVVTYEKYITVANTGNYYVGIHGVSDADQYYLFVDNIEISAPMSADAPGEVTNVVVTPDANGAKSVAISFNAPKLNFLGTADITEVTKVEVYRGETLVKTFENPTPGAALSFTDTPEETGATTYRFTPYNTAGEGKSFSESAYVGINVPGVPSNLVAVETSNVGEVQLTWEAPTVDVDGKPLNPSFVSYILVEIVNSSQSIIAQDLTTTSYTYQAVSADAEQEFKQYGVFAKTEGGVGSGVGSNLVAVGAPYAMPFEESFANAGVTHIFGTMTIANSGAWSLYNESTLGLVSVDGDDGFAAMKGSYLEASARLYSGKISLVDASNPELSFYTYRLVGSEGSPDINEIEVEISTDGTNFSTVKKFVISEDCSVENDWNKLTVNLSDYKGKVVFVSFKATTKAYVYTMVDAVRLVNGVADNMSAVSIEAPASVNVNQDFSVNVKVRNDGSNVANGYNVVLYRNGVAVQNIEGVSLESGADATYTFAESCNAASAESNEYYAEVVYDADMDKSDNKTKTVTTKVIQNSFPTVNNLTGAADVDAGKVTLEWAAPELGGAAVAKTDDFESYGSFATSAGDWTFYDKDGAGIGGISNISLPGIDSGSAQSFWVMDASNDVLNTSFAAHSGDKYLCQMYTVSGQTAVQCDDWAVSPLLSGSAQTISLWARSYSSQYPETFEILYSTTGKEVENFTRIVENKDISAEWTEYTAALPEGTKYFAIRCTSNDCFMFMVDDVTFTPAGAESYQILGYNIYRDGVKINQDVVTTTSYVDAAPTQGNHVYSVSVVYNVGESKVVSTEVEFTGVNGIVNGTLAINVLDRNIVVANAEGKVVTISTAEGKVIYRGVGKSELKVPVSVGIYVVKAGNMVGKLIVK